MQPKTKVHEGGESRLGAQAVWLLGLIASLLLSVAVAADGPRFSWDNAIVYFVMTDRFYNGNPDNDHSYGRKDDGEQEIGTFHGGDLKGLTAKLREGYFSDLGVNAIWITAPYQQILGWVVGGDKAFRHYGYHGYYALDYTLLDANMGTADELREFVDTAHGLGIRVLFDVVMNHPGYGDARTLGRYGVDVLWDGWEQATPRDYYSYFNFNSPNWRDWWGRDWVRSDLPGYLSGGWDDLSKQLAYLPDFRTDREEPVDLPPFYRHKTDTRAVAIEGYSVRRYLIRWLTDWVRQYGIDGFRCDTAKHVEPEAWVELKAAAVRALRDWKAANPDKKPDDLDFWMTGEAWGHGAERSGYFDYGFDSMINFDFQAVAGRPELMDPTFAGYARAVNADPGFNLLSYISSHDTKLFDRTRLVQAGTFLLLLPGGVQIYYGDESARPPGPSPKGDAQQATRSDMNWDSMDERLLSHWRRLGRFRNRHPAIAAGRHERISERPYTFSRAKDGDRVVVVVDAEDMQEVAVAGVFAEGTRVRDAYSGLTAQVNGGSVSLAADPNGVMLLEEVAGPAATGSSNP